MEGTTLKKGKYLSIEKYSLEGYTYYRIFLNDGSDLILDEPEYNNLVKLIKED